MAEGLTNAGTPERLRMSISAVEKHAASIFGKLGIAETAGYSRRVLAGAAVPGFVRNGRR